MPLHARSIAINMGVMCFFAIGLVGWCSGLLPLTCCKRALAGAIVAYMVITLAVKAINAILTNAIIRSHMKKLEERANGNRD